MLEQRIHQNRLQVPNLYYMSVCMIVQCRYKQLENLTSSSHVVVCEQEGCCMVSNGIDSDSFSLPSTACVTLYLKFVHWVYIDLPSILIMQACNDFTKVVIQGYSIAIIC
jgi:hypothetical protein